MADEWPTPGEIRALLGKAGRTHRIARGFLAEHGRAVAAVRAALEPLREHAARAELARIPAARLKDVTEGRLRLGPVEQAGYATVLDVLDATPYALQLLPGVGVQTATQLHAAARQIAAAAAETAPMRLDADDRTPEATALVIALHPLVNAGPELPRAISAARSVAGTLEPLLAAAAPARSRLRRLLAGRRRRAESRAALTALAGLRNDPETPRLVFDTALDLGRPPLDGTGAWIDFELQAPAYYGVLTELAGARPDRDRAEGFLPHEIADRVNAQPLDDAHRRVSLRGYQEFGARFALAQRRCILGDEMGLGKTVQAVAALAHLRSEGGTRFLVACPASVLVNWIREIEHRSTLRALRAHGPDRDAALAEWSRTGGVAVTTIDGLHALPVTDVAMLVVDEAHYVKNPATRRAKAVAAWADRADHVLFLTGTPMENRVEEFQNLVAMLQPGLRIDGSDAIAGAQAFRRSVGPAYLRRNQSDVLTELPELVHTEEWEEFSRTDLAAYRRAVKDGNFMAMRRAAYAAPKTSGKLKRLLELVAEARENGHKVVVFSFFREVLTTVHTALPDAFGPLAGDVPATRRQEIVDLFAAHPGHAVLLAQIQAGGVGLNLQAASVVILCEPQLKPTVESQAIARAHRMGQVRRVQVHRLLSPDSVDERVLALLRHKKALFDAYARRSDIAETTPEAIDLSDPSIARQIVEEEQLRLATA
ncbi:DEAD/DEAH box helicase [Actinocorallia populi]|uniref:DEAD/DEAH box helicase n=1 Tax=Actinocorallia populi TaxID=2079200 RepID=UPI000D096737|nr:DEAD/DEAH box helicase [Actinocorallia populi]